MLGTKRLVQNLEGYLFRRRAIVLAGLLLLTVLMAFKAMELRISTHFDKQIPVGHEYSQVFFKYRNELFGTNRLMISLRARNGDIWNPTTLGKLHQITQSVLFLPGVDRRSVQSLWTPNILLHELTEEGFHAENVIGGNITPDNLDANKIEQIRDRVVRGGYQGSLVSRDGTATMVIADILDENIYLGQKLDYLDLSSRLETEIRQKYETHEHAVEIIGFAKQMGAIADGAGNVYLFFGLAFLLTALAVYGYCRSIRLTLLPLLCSLCSVLWQFGMLAMLGLGLDPLAILIPFLIFAIGVSHGVQQINAISSAVARGKNPSEAARESFSSLLLPGTLALFSALIGFVSLLPIPIPMIRELAIAAAIGVGFKVVTNLVMLPLAASYLSFPPSHAVTLARIQARRSSKMRRIAWVADIHNAKWVLGTAILLLFFSVWQSLDRQVGALQGGVPELRAESRYNRDMESITNRFDMGMDVLTVVFETPTDGCTRFDVFDYLDQFTQHLSQVRGVISVTSLSTLTKTANALLNEGNPKMLALPRDSRALQAALGFLPESSGLLDRTCTMMATNLHLSDHRAETIQTVINTIKSFRKNYPPPDSRMQVLLASGNVGIMAAINEEIEAREFQMMVLVYTGISLLVLLAYRDWRAILVCCLPLTLATFLGYVFMKALGIGLTVATLPVMVLTTGIGVDYAFYLYNRLLIHLSQKLPMRQAVEESLNDVGMATLFTAITLSLGVSTWIFSPLKFQADMGALLTFMFMANMVLVITVMPAFVAILEKVSDRNGLPSATFAAR